MSTQVSGTLMFHSNGDSVVAMQEVAGIVESLRRLGYPVAVTISIALEGEVEHSAERTTPVQEVTPAAENFLSAALAGADERLDWGVTGLSSVAHQAVMAMEAKTTTWRKLPKVVRLELIQSVLAQPTASGEPMTMSEFNKLRPAWMAAGEGLPTTFGCAWSELSGLRLTAG